MTRPITLLNELMVVCEAQFNRNDPEFVKTQTSIQDAIKKKNNAALVLARSKLADYMKKKGLTDPKLAKDPQIQSLMTGK